MGRWRTLLALAGRRCCDKLVRFGLLQIQIAIAKSIHVQEVVGKASGRETQVRPGALGPLIVHDLAVNTHYLHIFEPSRDRVEPSRKSNHVELVMRAILLYDAVGYESINWVCADVNNVNVRLSLISTSTNTVDCADCQAHPVELIVEILLK